MKGRKGILVHHVPSSQQLRLDPASIVNLDRFQGIEPGECVEWLSHVVRRRKGGRISRCGPSWLTCVDCRIKSRISYEWYPGAPRGLHPGTIE